MPPALKLLLRLFVPFSCAFGGFMGLLAALVSSGWGLGPALLTGAVTAVVTGVPFGASVALGLGGWHLLSVRRLGHRLTAETIAVHQRRRLTVPQPFAAAYDLCAASVRYLGNATLEEESDHDAGVLLAAKGMSWHSWGEQIRFHLRPVEGGTEVEVECRPRVPTALLDNGTSLRNMDAIVGFLLAHGASAPVATSDQIRTPTR